ncbi:MAG: sigma-70 family RNA polymerase sigma factor [Planctomycetes bacterium]|nr:sigma-70 family RNA polymerase sigma factor [Planctomycetota bacterium]
MKDQATEMGGPGGGFPDTRWESILDARDGKGRRDHLERLCRDYWKPVYLFIRHDGRRPNEEAKDLTQAFFARLLSGDFLAGLDPSKGRFRTFLKACLRHFLFDARKEQRTLKRGKGATVLSLDDAELPVAAHGTAPEAAFDREWLRGILEDAVAETERSLAAGGPDSAFRFFRRVDLDPAAGGARPTYAEVAREFAVPEQAVKSGVALVRRRLRGAIQARVRSYCASDDEADREMRELFP